MRQAHETNCSIAVSFSGLVGVDGWIGLQAGREGCHIFSGKTENISLALTFLPNKLSDQCLKSWLCAYKLPGNSQKTRL